MSRKFGLVHTFLSQNDVLQNKAEREKNSLLWANDMVENGMEYHLKGFSVNIVDCSPKDNWPPIIQILSVPFFGDEANQSPSNFVMKYIEFNVFSKNLV